MAYKAGSLDVILTAIDSGTAKSIDVVITKLSSLSTILKSVSTADMKWINSFGTKMKNLSKKMNEIDWGKLDSGFNRLTTAITPFIDKVNSAQAGLTAMYGILQKVSGKKFGNIISAANGSGKLGGSFSSLFNFGKFAGALYLARRLGGAVANIVQYGTDFTETLNMWQVAMRENLDQADEFITKMNKAYSISQQTLMNAQATFKNMIGSLGNISDAVSYQLSESILQMAVDFSSLYNTTFENAIQKFQAVLAGQVRPIRSVSGYDITETTLYQVYQQMGGTKTQRQLNRTEKQLLSIYAVFQQMQRSGAVGDLSKTLDNFANQSRMVNENFKELKTYVGLFLQDLLQSWGVLKYVNAALIFATEVVKALINYEEPNFIEGMFETTIAENKALDELQGKLLDFDKFRALDTSSTTSDLELDQTILNSVSQYQSILENVNNSARELATKWLKDIGLFTENENGELEISDRKLKGIESTLKGIASAVGVIFGYNLINTVGTLITKIGTLTNAMSVLDAVMIGSIIFSFVKMIESFENLDYWGGMLYATIFGGLVIAFVALRQEMIKTTVIKIIQFFQNIQLQGALATTVVQKLQVAMMYLGVALGAAIGSFAIFDSIINQFDGSARRVVSVISIVIGALSTLLGVILAIKGGLKGGLLGATIAGLGVGALLAGIKGVATQSAKIDTYAIGASNIDSGTMFIAGEAGKTEAVYTGSNGKTNVANVQQMKSAFYQALVEYGESHSDNQPIVVTLDGEVVYRNTTAQAKKRGQFWSK